MRTTVVVVTWRGERHLAQCLDAVAAQRRAHRTLVVDNASDDGTAELLSRYRVPVLRLPRNVGYAGGLDAALPAVRTPFMAWLNDDAVPEPGWLDALEDALDACPEAAVAGAHLLDAEGRTQSLGVALTEDGHGVDTSADPFGFCGGAALVRVDALRHVGGLPRGFFCYYEDTDTSWRLRLAGHEIVAVPAARVGHRHGASTAPGSWDFHRWNERNRLLMLLRCAPARVAVTELVRFTVLTALLPSRAIPPPVPANFTTALRRRVLREVLAAAPSALRARRAVPTGTLGKQLWREWAGARGGDLAPFPPRS